MFKVKYKKNYYSQYDEIYTVYDVKCSCIQGQDFTQFLIYNGDEWEWDSAKNYEPV